jgi:hypothetical protein
MARWFLSCPHCHNDFTRTEVPADAVFCVFCRKTLLNIVEVLSTM